MAVVPVATLKTNFQTGDFPNQDQFEDLIDTLADLPSAATTGNNLKTVEYTIGVSGVTGVDYNFTSVANAVEQSIQLGGTTIIPARATVLTITTECVIGLNGAITGTFKLGVSSGGTEFMNGPSPDDTGEMIAVQGPSSTTFYVSSSAASIYFSVTPSANWNTVTTGSWKIWITYLDNSII